MRLQRGGMCAWLLAGTLASPWVTASKASPEPNGAEHMKLDHLFDAELQYRPEMKPIVSAEGRTGRLLGSGDGRIGGSRIKGRIRWSIFEEQGVGECKTNIAGLIETDDGSRIEVETRGFGVVADPARPNQWRMSAALQFKADGKYEWLKSVAAIWTGTFDMDTGRHSYTAYSGR